MANIGRIRAAIDARLRGTAGAAELAADLADIVGDRIYGADVPGDTRFPYVRVLLASGGAGAGDRDLESREAVARPAFDVSIVGRSAGGFDDLQPGADLLDSLLDSWRVEPGSVDAGVYGGAFIVERDGEIEEPEDLGGDSYEYTLGGIYRFTYCPAGA